MQSDGSVGFRDESGVIQAFLNDDTTAQRSATLAGGRVFMLLAPPPGTVPPTLTYRLVYIGSDPTVQATTGVINLSF